MLTIAHIVHPVVVAPPSDLVVAQPVTFETMRAARELASDSVDVKLLAVQYADEAPVPLPSCFVRTPTLRRSVVDVGQFSELRKLALIRDILETLFAASDAEYFIYTNVDIAVQPHFYLTVARLIESGHDAVVINRRTISDSFTSVDEIPLMLAELGEPHIGHDCFVFRREVFPRFHLGNTCIGTRLVGRVLLWNLLATASRFVERKDLHATFHIGAVKPWKDPAFADYDRHNHAEALGVLRRLDEEYHLLSRLQADHPDYLVAVDWRALTCRENRE